MKRAIKPVTLMLLVLLLMIGACACGTNADEGTGGALGEAGNAVESAVSRVEDDVESMFGDDNNATEDSGENTESTEESTENTESTEPTTENSGAISGTGSAMSKEPRTE